MTKTLEMIYKNGVLHPLEPVELPEGQRVMLTIVSPVDELDTVKAEQLQKEKAKLRQMLLDGINSGEPVEVTDETWKAKKRDLEKRFGQGIKS